MKPLCGLLLLLAARLAVCLQVVKLPDITPYPRLDPADSGYPGNIPPDLPTTLPLPPPVLTYGGTTGCATTVADVLAANGRRGFLALLQQSPMGAAVLSGAYLATLLAPSDEALAALAITPEAVAANPLLPATIANYHILQGVRPLGALARASRSSAFGGYNTTLTEAYCPTAYQVVNVLRGGAFGTSPSSVFVRSAETTAAIVGGDIPACQALVHLTDGVLQPCCTSLYEMLPKFSIVQITPSYFDGYRKQPPPDNTDGSNRRLFEEQLLDMLLFMSAQNATRTILWPAPSAWDGFKLAPLLPNTNLSSIETRIHALKILGLYMLSYQQVLLPKDTRSKGAASADLPFLSALRNGTSTKVWNCTDSLLLTGSGSANLDQKLTLAAATAGQGAFALNQQTVAAAPGAPVDAVAEVPAAADAQAAAGQQGAAPVEVPVLVLPAETPAAVSPAASAAPAATRPVVVDPAATDAVLLAGAPAAKAPAAATPLPSNLSAVEEPGLVVDPAAASGPTVAEPDAALTVPTDPAAIADPATPVEVRPANPLQPASLAGLRRRRLQATGTGLKTVKIVDTYETCEGLRVLVVDAVVVPCNFEALVKASKLIDAQLAAFAFTGLPDSFYSDPTFLQMVGLNASDAATPPPQAPQKSGARAVVRWGGAAAVTMAALTMAAAAVLAQ